MGRQVRPIAFITIGPNEEGKVSLDISSGPEFRLAKAHIQQAWDAGCAAFVKAFSATLEGNITQVEQTGQNPYPITDAMLQELTSNNPTEVS